MTKPPPHTSTHPLISILISFFSLTCFSLVLGLGFKPALAVKRDIHIKNEKFTLLETTPDTKPQIKILKVEFELENNTPLPIEGYFTLEGYHRFGPDIVHISSSGFAMPSFKPEYKREYEGKRFPSFVF